MSESEAAARAPQAPPRPKGQVMLNKERDIAEALRQWIDAAPIINDANGDPTIAPVYGAHVLLCSLIEEVEALRAELTAVTQERNEARYNARVLASSWKDDARPPASIVTQSLTYAVDQRDALPAPPEAR